MAVGTEAAVAVITRVAAPVVAVVLAAAVRVRADTGSASHPARCRQRRCSGSLGGCIRNGVDQAPERSGQAEYLCPLIAFRS